MKLEIDREHRKKKYKKKKEKLINHNLNYCN